MTEPRLSMRIDEPIKIESDASGDWVSYTAHNTGTEDLSDGDYVVRYEALCGSDVQWTVDDVGTGVPAGQPISTTRMLNDEGKDLPDGDYVVWVTILDGSDASPAWANVATKVTDQRFAAT